MNKDFVRVCYEEFDPIRLFEDAPMRFHTTFRIGGPADLLFYPKNTEEVQKIIRLAKKYDEPVTWLGNGSNILVRDGGIRGLVIRFSHKMEDISHEAQGHFFEMLLPLLRKEVSLVLSLPVGFRVVLAVPFS